MKQYSPQLLLVVLFLFLAGCAQPSAIIPDAPFAQAPAVVFDVDGTLTPCPLKVWEARPNAASAVQCFAKNGYQIIYLSHRIKLLRASLSGWLRENGFPDGIIHVPTGENALDAARFKIRMLTKFQARGWKILFAFGDSTTDFEAYAAVGIPKAGVFALRREGEDACREGAWRECLTVWTDPRVPCK